MYTIAHAFLFRITTIPLSIIGDVCLTFYLHMHGNQMGRLSVIKLPTWEVLGQWSQAMHSKWLHIAVPFRNENQTNTVGLSCSRKAVKMEHPLCCVLFYGGQLVFIMT